MKDWKNLIADEDRIIGKHYTPGRGGHRIEYVILHHNAGALSIADCYNTWQTRPASANYQVEVGGRIGQLVRDRDTSWNAGNFAANQRSIAIEHANSGGAAQGWPISEATRENGAHLVAALCLYYGLGRPQWGVNVYPHQHFSSTACPGQLATTYRADYMARAGQWYDAMAAGKAAPAAPATPATTAPAAPAKPSVAKTATDGQDMLDVDGIQGTRTQARFEQVMGVTINGIDEAHEPAFMGLQKFLNTVVSRTDIKNLTGKPQLEVDGIAGAATWRVFQYVAWNWAASYVKTLPTGKSFGTFVDGVAGPDTIKALQWMLNNSYANSGKLLSK